MSIMGSCEFEARYFGKYTTLVQLPGKVGGGMGCIIFLLRVERENGADDELFLSDLPAPFGVPDTWTSVPSTEEGAAPAAASEAFGAAPDVTTTDFAGASSAMPSATAGSRRQAPSTTTR
jgi:hypothetical protein